MLVIRSHSSDPYFNLALEEYLLRQKDEDIFMLWQSTPTVVVGKHQNTLSEVNLIKIISRGIKVARRLTGGGAVYHDEGNVNFTFIRNSPPGSDKKIEYREFTLPIINALEGLGIQAEHGERNDLLLNGLKFSGNAEHFDIKRKRTLHHGTLLFSSDLNTLNGVLRNEHVQFEDRSVQSVRSTVTNLKDHLSESEAMNTDGFIQYLLDHWVRTNPGSEIHELGKGDLTSAEQLKLEKFTSWDWVYGYSPSYKMRKILRDYGGKELVLFVSEGIIQEASLSAAFKPLESILSGIVGTRHFPSEIKDTLEKMGVYHSLEAVVSGPPEYLFF